MRASANCTNEARRRWSLRIKDPDYQPPRYEPRPKEPGSKVLQFGEWVEVQEQDAK